MGSIKNSTVNTISQDINNLCIQQIFANEVYARETSPDGEFPEAEIYLAVTDESGVIQIGRIVQNLSRAQSVQTAAVAVSVCRKFSVIARSNLTIAVK